MFQEVDYQVLKHIMVHNNRHLLLLLTKRLKTHKIQLYTGTNLVDLVKDKYH